MHKIRVCTLFFFCTMFAAGVVLAADNASIQVNYEVIAINEINIDSAAVTLQISTATAGVDPNSVNASTTYDITTNCGTNGKKLTAVLDTAMPANTTLSLNVTAPAGAVSGGAMTMSDVAADVVTGIDAVASANLNMTFTLAATATAGVIAADHKHLTLTISN